MRSFLRFVPLLLVLAVTAGCDDGGGAGASAGRRPDIFEQTRREIERARNAPLPRGNVRVTITRYEFDRRDHSRRNLFLGYRDASVRVRAGRLGRNGVSVFAVRDGFESGISVARRHSVRQEVARQFLVLMPGYEAAFEAVRIRHEAWPVVVPVWYGYELGYTIRERITGTGMKVRVHKVAPGNIEVELTPYFHRADRRGILEVNELRTRINMIPGRSYVIASDHRAASNFGSAFFSSHRESRDREVVILLKAEAGGGGGVR